LSAVFLQLLFQRFHYAGWERYSAGEVRRNSRDIIRDDPRFGRITELVRSAARKVRAESRALILKDFLQFLRSSGTIQQLLILSSLVVVYLFSIAALPLDWQGYAVHLKYLTSFFNLGFILMILASVCFRLVYSSVAAEAGAFWLIKASPVTARRFVATKFMFFFLPVLVTGQLLTITSYSLIGIETNFILLMSLTCLLVSFSLVSMTIAFGISGFGKNTTDTQKGTGSTLFMISSVVLILVTLALEALPTFLYFLKSQGQAVFAGKGWLILGATVIVILSVNVFVSLFSFRLAIRKLENLDLSN
jgi:hypothetical protein